MLAPYFSGLLALQSDFGHPAGAVLGDAIVSDFSPKIWLVARIAAPSRRVRRIRFVGGGHYGD